MVDGNNNERATHHNEEQAESLIISEPFMFHNSKHHSAADACQDSNLEDEFENILKNRKTDCHKTTKFTDSNSNDYPCFQPANVFELQSIFKSKNNHDFSFSNVPNNYRSFQTANKVQNTAVDYNTNNFKPENRIQQASDYSNISKISEYDGLPSKRMRFAGFSLAKDHVNLSNHDVNVLNDNNAHVKPNSDLHFSNEISSNMYFKHEVLASLPDPCIDQEQNISNTPFYYSKADLDDSRFELEFENILQNRNKKTGAANLDPELEKSRPENNLSSDNSFHTMDLSNCFKPSINLHNTKTADFVVRNELIKLKNSDDVLDDFELQFENAIKKKPCSIVEGGFAMDGNFTGFQTAKTYKTDDQDCSNKADYKNVQKSDDSLDFPDDSLSDLFYSLQSQEILERVLEKTKCEKNNDCLVDCEKIEKLDSSGLFKTQKAASGKSSTFIRSKPHELSNKYADVLHNKPCIKKISDSDLELHDVPTHDYEKQQLSFNSDRYIHENLQRKNLFDKEESISKQKSELKFINISQNLTKNPDTKTFDDSGLQDAFDAIISRKHKMNKSHIVIAPNGEMNPSVGASKFSCTLSVEKNARNSYETHSVFESCSLPKLEKCDRDTNGGSCTDSFIKDEKLPSKTQINDSLLLSKPNSPSYQSKKLLNVDIKTSMPKQPAINKKQNERNFDTKVKHEIQISKCSENSSVDNVGMQKVHERAHKFVFDTQRSKVSGHAVGRPIRSYLKPEVGHQSVEDRDFADLLHLKEKIHAFFPNVENSWLANAFKWSYLHVSLRKYTGFSRKNMFDKFQLKKTEKKFIKIPKEHVRVPQAKTTETASKTFLKKEINYGSVVSNTNENSSKFNSIPLKCNSDHGHSRTIKHLKSVPLAEINKSNYLLNSLVEQMRKFKDSEYSIFRRIIEGDDCSGKYMKFMVISANETNLRVFDGFYSIKITVDSELRSLVLSKKIRTGTVLRTFAAKLLIPTQDIFSVDKNIPVLSISYNSTRACKFTHRLGYQKKLYHITYLQYLKKQGGVICGLELSIVRIIETKILFKVKEFATTCYEKDYERMVDKIKSLLEKAKIVEEIEWNVNKYTKMIMKDVHGDECLFSWFRCNEDLKTGAVYRFINLSIGQNDIGLHVITNNQTYSEEIRAFKL